MKNDHRTIYFRISLYLYFVTMLYASNCVALTAPKTHTEEWQPPKNKISSKKIDAIWTGVRSEQLDTTKPLGLEKVVDIALTNNPSTKLAWEQAKSVQARKGQAESEWFPQVSGTFNAKQNKFLSNTGASDYNRFTSSPSAQASLLLFDFGGREARTRGAYQDLLKANFTFNQSIENVIQDASTSYYELYSAQSSVEAARYDVANSKATLYAAEAKYQAGIVTKLDVLESRSDYYNKLYSLEQARGALKQKQGLLCQTLGISADTKISIEPPPRLLFTPIAHKNVSELIEMAMKKRPDIMSRRASVQAKEETWYSSLTALLPSLEANNSIGRDYYNNYNSTKRYNSELNYSVIGFTVTWDIFDGFDNLNKVKQARADAEAEKQQLKADELETSQDVWEKYYDLKTSIRKVLFAKASLKSSEASYTLALESYKAGVKSLLDLIQAMDDLSAARSAVITSRRELFIARVHLSHAIGLLFESKEYYSRDSMPLDNL